MKREEKNKIVDTLTDTINNTKHFYLTDLSGLNAEDTNMLRRKCFERDIRLIVVKNTLLKRALNKCSRDYNDLYGILKDSTSIMLADTGNIPAKLIKDFRKTHDRPVLKAAFVEDAFYIGDEQLDFLAGLKSREELIADVLLLLQSPVKNVLSALQSGGNKLAGIIKTLSEKK
jgi:large subunit ribosomal protein L10